jgi:hypothetical protein
VLPVGAVGSAGRIPWREPAWDQPFRLASARGSAATPADEEEFVHFRCFDQARRKGESPLEE